ncbi:MAG: ZPR1 zinc finger domain-containing protein [Methanobrevibacter sp.]|nr:ZPR1 zinc finger domain-containing protein [Candidatus Methanoflexus mossambicus]
MKIDCPVCGGIKTAKSITKTNNIPYFGEMLESTVICDKCGFKHNDEIVLEQKDPIRLELVINSSNLSSRVVKSPSATVSIPELGLKVEPGPKSKSYVSNVEGVLIRFNDAVKRALTLFTDVESQKNGNEILNIIKNILSNKNDEKIFTLVIEDPFGKSQIMDLKTKKRHLSDEELKKLKTGITIIE